MAARQAHTGLRVRFGVPAIRAERERLLGSGIEVLQVTSPPGVVAFADFADPRKNAPGCCQNLTQSRQPAMVGGSVHDADLLVTDRSASPASEVQFMHGRPNPNTQNSPIGAASASPILAAQPIRTAGISLAVVLIISREL